VRNSCRLCENAPARRCWRYSLVRHEGGTDQRHSQRRNENPFNIAFVGNSVDQAAGTPALLGLSGRHCGHQLGEPDNIENAPEIIGRRGQAGFGTDLLQAAHPKRPLVHSLLDRAERVFDCLVAQACGRARRSVLGTVSASRRNRQRNLVDAVQSLTQPAAELYRQQVSSARMVWAGHRSAGAGHARRLRWRHAPMEAVIILEQPDAVGCPF